MIPANISVYLYPGEGGGVNEIHHRRRVIEIGIEKRHASDIYVVYCVRTEGTVLEVTMSQAASEWQM